MAKGSQKPGVGVIQVLFGSCRIDESAHCGNAIGRKSHSPSMLLDGRFVRSQVDAVHLVTCDVAMKPLDPRPHFLQNLHRLLRNFSQLCFGETSGSGNFAFNDKFGHGRLTDAHKC